MAKRTIGGKAGAAILAGAVMFVGVGGVGEAARATDQRAVAEVKCVVGGLRMVEMTEAEVRSHAVRCGKALTLKGPEIQKMGADLTRLHRIRRQITVNTR
jgi:hypothetical protein